MFDVAVSENAPAPVLARSMDEISVKDVLDCVGENINPARDILGVPSSGIESRVDVLTYAIKNVFHRDFGP